MIEQLKEQFGLTEEQVKSVIDSASYQRWKANALASVDWRYWCFKTLYPNKGTTTPDNFKMYVYIFLERDTEFVKPMARAIEFILWVIDTQYSRDDEVVHKLLRGYAKNYLALIEEIVNKRFKKSEIYDIVMSVISEFKASSCNSGTSVKGCEMDAVETRVKEFFFQSFADALPETQERFTTFIRLLIEHHLGELREGGVKTELPPTCLAVMLGAVFYDDKIEVEQNQALARVTYYGGGSLRKELNVFFCEKDLNGARLRVNRNGSALKNWRTEYTKIVQTVKLG